jgi:hypothetical protein
MTKGRPCTYEGDRDEQIVAFIYGERGASERAQFESHVETCAACRDEVADLGVVRAQLSRWTPPMPALDLQPVGRPAIGARAHPVSAAVLTTLHGVPAWAQVAAALLFVGVSAAVANLDVRYDQAGLSVRTGWSAQGGGTAAAGVVAPAVSGAAVSGQPWRSDLESLERQLRAEFSATRTPAAERPVAAREPASEADVMRNVRALIEESERRQQRELALHLAETTRDVEVQRRADLQRIDSMIQGHLGAVQNTGVEVMRQRRMINDLAIRVAQRP